MASTMPSGRVLVRGASRISRPPQRVSQPVTPKPTYICARCKSQGAFSQNSHPPNATDPDPSAPPPPQPDFHQIFAKPTWSVRSLLPDTTTSASPSADPDGPSASPPSQEITPKTLHHLLRLSALPPPSSPREEASMLSNLHTQLHFVRSIQSVDTAGVTPLRAIRDETAAGTAEATVTLGALRDALQRETKFGFRRRPRRIREGLAEDRTGAEEERLVERAMAGRRERGYYVVDSGKAKGGE